jgi:hypothetical protein
VQFLSIKETKLVIEKSPDKKPHLPSSSARNARMERETVRIFRLLLLSKPYPGIGTFASDFVWTLVHLFLCMQICDPSLHERRSSDSPARAEMPARKSPLNFFFFSGSFVWRLFFFRTLIFCLTNQYIARQSWTFLWERRRYRLVILMCFRD